jgi:membrane-bound lytic murein transglycosylase D
MHLSSIISKLSITLLGGFLLLPSVGLSIVKQTNSLSGRLDSKKSESKSSNQYQGVATDPEFYENFITDPFVRRQVRFWEAIFQKYDASTAVIHDLDEPDAMIDVINFNKYVQKNGETIQIPAAAQNAIVRRYIERYDLAVSRFKSQKERAVSYGAIEKRVLEVYQRDPIKLARLFRGDVTFRSQTGLSDTFYAAAQRAQEYLPYMEATFKKANLPIHLTRLPFVESMFNLSARSKVGASGIWQFMPGTAREYMAVNSTVDERNSPYKATVAASKLLRENYIQLGSWPLALTAYNHGRAGMARASRTLGTTELGTIIKKYKSPSFGFASKNFYAEFIAAVTTYDLLQRSNMISKLPITQNISSVTLSRALSLKEISEKSKLSINQIADLNPCVNRQTVLGNPSKLLPRNYLLRLSKEGAQNLKKTKLASIQTALVDRTTSRRQ